MKLVTSSTGIVVLGLFMVSWGTGCGSGSTQHPIPLDGGTGFGPDSGSMDSRAEYDLLLPSGDTPQDRGFYDLISNRDAASTSPPEKRPQNAWAQPMCVWNQAYQENFASDTIAEILSGARECYVLLDPFDSSEARSAIPYLKQHKNLIGCYISVGTCEDWRDDYTSLKPYCITKVWDEWEGEYFIHRTDPGLIDQMKLRIDKMAAWGCEFVEFDNMDWTFDPENRTKYGVSATAAQGEAYNQTLCAYVHQQGMGCMAKSSAQGAADFDGLTVESSRQDMDWWQPMHMKTMLETGKIGIVVHYDESDCVGVRTTYQEKYGAKLSFICEDRMLKKYRHFP